MNFKLSTSMVITFLFGLFVLLLTYDAPIAYVSYGASKLEYTMSYVIFIVSEVSALSFLLIYIINKLDPGLHRRLSQMLR